MKKVALNIMCSFMIITLCSCSNNSAAVSSKSIKNVVATAGKDTTANNVTYAVSFMVLDPKSAPLSDVMIALINMNGDVIDVETTNKDGQANKTLTVPIDKRYYITDGDSLGPRGTVTAIAYKKGYREQVLLEVPVSAADSLQEIILNPEAAGERNEPDVQAGSSHHLEILSLTEKYSKYFRSK